MSSITVISATNRPSSYTEKIARYYESALQQDRVPVLFFALDQLPPSIITSDLYGKRSPEMQAIIDTYIVPSSRLIFVTPEYNGSFPGLLKIMLEAVHPKLWADKDACLVGVATGRGGNLRGMEHLTTILQYLKMHVYHDKLPISKVDTLFKDGAMFDEDTMKAIGRQIKGFLEF